MYPCPMLHSYYQRCENETPRRALNRMIDQAMLKDTDCTELEPPILRLNSTHPQFYAPHVDVTRAKCAFGRQALPKLRKELHSGNPLTVRQAVNTIADLVHSPENAVEAIRLRIPDRLADLLASDDPFLRERVAMIYTTIAGQSNGAATITKNPVIVYNLAKGLNDRHAYIRLKAAGVIEMLARNWMAAEDLCAIGFVDLILDRITVEKKEILVVYLATLKLLLDRDSKIHALEIGMMEKLVILLGRKDSEVLANCLECLAILCSEPLGKQKSIDMDLLDTLKPFLEDERRSVHTKAAAVIAMVTITTPGKLRALNLQIMGRLLELAADFHCRELQLSTFKIMGICAQYSGSWSAAVDIGAYGPKLCDILLTALTNIAEVPKGRCLMLQTHIVFIEDVDTCGDETVERHKQILLDTIRWQP